MQKSERYAALFLIVCGIAIVIYAYHFLKLGEITEPGAGFLPFLVGLGLTVLGAVWILTGKKVETGEETAFASKLWYKPAIAIGLMVAYAWAMDALGYILSTLAFMVVWMIVIEREKWLRILLVSTLGTAGMYLLFSYFLQVQVPKEFFMR
jgi:putative tricarboxylic transport membrane protein